MMFQIENKPFLTIKTKIFQHLKTGIFAKGLTHTFGQTMIFFSLIFFSDKKGVEIKFYDVLDTKQTFFVYKNKIIQSLKKAFFQRD